MALLTWDQTGERLYETGVDHGVLYLPNATGVYDTGFAWNGLVSVTESPSGAESNPQYADNIKYLNLVSAEEFGATVEAFTYPDEFAQCDGTAMPQPGVAVGQQNRKPFGLCYRTRLGNDLNGSDHGYKLHLVYNAQAAPSEKAYATINDSPEAITFSWELTTTPVEVGTVGGVTYKPTATLTIDSTKVNAAALTTLEEFLYGTAGTDPSLPAPADVLGLFEGTITTVTPVAPTYDSGTDTITIPSVTGVNYYINNELVTGSVVITADTMVTAKPAAGYKFLAGTDDDWFFDFS
jgi:hypothetical protein